MKLGRSKSEQTETPVVADEGSEPTLGKGRPTPKRRDSIGPRGPVSAPKTRKEAYARQKELSKQARTAGKATNSTGNLTVAQRREMLRRGDPSVLPKRDQGTTRKLARDWVDSRRMASNYLLVLFPLIIVGYLLPILQLVVLAAFVGLLAEWFVTGTRIRKLAIERHGSAQGGALGIGFYAGSRAYLPRRWRLPAPQVNLGDTI